LFRNETMKTRLAAICAAVILVSMAFCSVGFAGAALPRAHSKSATQPTLSQLVADIAASSHVSQVPNLNTTIPPLSSLTPLDETLPMPSPCYSLGDIKFPADPAKKCAWGDPHAHRTIYIFGDSQAAMWLPAFASIGSELGWKVVLLAKAGCPPWEYDSTSNYSMGNGLDQFSCRRFLSQEISFATTNHPQIVIPIGDDSTTGGPTDYATSANYETELSLLLTDLKPSGGKVLFLSEFPQYFQTMTPTTCLTVHGNDVTACSLSPDTITTRAISVAMSQFSQTSNTPLINVQPLFCTATLCPLFVKSSHGTYLIHVESYHMNRFYSTWIGRALGQLVEPYL
jgi:hypothetical protein